VIGYIFILGLGIFSAWKTGSWLVALAFIAILAIYNGFRTLHRRYHGEE
jgi:hypothetical protein